MHHLKMLLYTIKGHFLRCSSQSVKAESAAMISLISYRGQYSQIFKSIFILEETYFCLLLLWRSHKHHCWLVMWWTNCSQLPLHNRTESGMKGFLLRFFLLQLKIIWVSSPYSRYTVIICMMKVLDFHKYINSHWHIFISYLLIKCLFYSCLWHFFDIS